VIAAARRGAGSGQKKASPITGLARKFTPPLQRNFCGGLSFCFSSLGGFSSFGGGAGRSFRG
jgi:hypothetical protein